MASRAGEPIALPVTTILSRTLIDGAISGSLLVAPARRGAWREHDLVASHRNGRDVRAREKIGQNAADRHGSADRHTARSSGTDSVL